MTSIIIARAFGIYLVIIAVATFTGGKRFLNQTQAIVTEPGLALFSAIITLLLGAFLVAIHNVWVTGWPVIITLLCWITLIKGTVRVLFPQVDLPMSRFFTEYHTFTKIIATLIFILGLYLCYLGFII